MSLFTQFLSKTDNTGLSKSAATQNRKPVHFMRWFSLMLAGIMMFSGISFGQLSITTANSAVTQNFDGLAQSGSTNAASGSIFGAGWSFLETGSNANLTYSGGTGSSGTGDTYSFGVAGVNTVGDRAFGMLQSGSLSSILGFKFTNNTGLTITSLTIGYTGEEWRTATATDNIAFSYQLADVALNAASGWTPVATLAYATTVNATATATDGNATANRTVKGPVSVTGLSIAPGTTVTLRWVDVTGSSSAGMAIDDFTITLVGTPACTPPTSQASALTTSAPGSTQFTSNWIAGTGDGTMIVIRPTTQTLQAPSSGTAYAADPSYASAGQINTNNRVIFRAAGTTVTATGLLPQTQYTVTAYEYASTGDCYNLSSPLSSTIYTLSTEPSAHAASFTATGTGPNSILLGFSAASSITAAAGYIILQKTGLTAPTGIPSDATAYSVGNTIGDGTVAAIITSTSATSASIIGLSGNTNYSFTLIPYNWNGSIAATYNYYTAPTIPSATTATTSLIAPTVTTPTATTITNNSAILGGNVTSDGGDPIGERGIVWSVTSVNSDPTTADNKVTTTGTTGVFTVATPGLPVATQISYKAYATNGQGTGYTTPASTFFTLANPTSTIATGITVTAFTSNSVSLSWTNGDGANRILVARTAARVAPTNGTAYTVNSTSFTDGTNGTTGTGNIVVFNGSGSSVTVTGLTAGTSYTFDIYEYNGGANTANYGAVASATKSTLAAEPLTQATNVTFTNVSSTGFKINWTLGSGANSLVLVKDVSAVDADPVDATTYTALPAFGSGDQIGTGNFVVYKNATNNVAVTGLVSGHTYHVAVYTYNGSGGLENYLTLTPARGNQIAETQTYYSQGSLDPSVLTSWNTVRAGGGSSPGSLATDVANFVIQNGHTMTTTTAFALGVSGSKIQIESGGVLSAGHPITIPAGATFQIDDNGKYVATASISSAIFGGTEVFAPNSTVEYDANPTGTSIPTSPGYGNLVINVTTGASAFGWGGNITNIQKDFKVLGTGNAGVRHAFTTTATMTVNIGGDFIVTGGNFWLSSGANAVVTVNVTGSLNINGGLLDLGNTANAAGTINVGGDVSVTSGTLTKTGATSNSKIVFNKNGAQSFTSGGAITGIVNFEVVSGSVTSLGTSTISGAGTVTVDGGATLKVGSLSASGAIAGNITATGGVVLPSGSTVEFNGASAQFAASRTFSNLRINNTSGVTLNGAITVGANLDIASGAKLNLANVTSTALTLSLGGVGAASGPWSSTTYTGTAHKNDNYFASGTSGVLNVTNGTCAAITVSPAAPLADGNTTTSYNQTFSASGGTGSYTYSVSSGSLPPGVTLTGGTISGTPTAGGDYSFVITATDGNFCTGSTSYSIHVVCNSVYTITVTAGAGGSITPATGSVNCGDNATYTITPNACYTIADVVVDGVSQGAVGTYTFTNVTADHTISATFVQNTYTITVTAGANGSITPATGSVNCGDNATYTITPNACYSIADVVVDGVSQGAVGTYTFTNVTATHTISATFVATTYTITVTAGANGSITPATGSVNCGDNATYTITPNACYSIADVVVDGVSQGAVGTYTFTNVTAAHTISATFVATTYTITVTAGANGSITPATGSVNCGDNATYTITPNACYSIADVVVDGVSQGAVGTYTFTNVTAAHTISATFVATTYTITVTAGANGSITPATGSVNCGDNATYTITPNACYSIADVVVDGVSQGAVGTYTFTNVTAAHTISATFVTTTYTITVTAGANGSITPATGPVNCGDNATYTITPNGGYAIADVVVDGVSQGAISAYTFTNVTATHTISATFVISAFTITSSAGSNGSISPNGVTPVSSGGSQAYTITPNSCYHIQDVLVDAVSVGAVSNYTFTNVTANHTISASFASNAALAAPVVSGPVNVCQYVGTATQVTYTATSNVPGTSFSWLLPPNVTPVGGTTGSSITVTFQSGFTNQANKQIKVTASTSAPCAASQSTTYYLLSQLPNLPSPIVGTTSVCTAIGSGTLTYTIHSVLSATDYLWQPPAGSTITHTNGLGVNDTTITLSFSNGYATGDLKVQAHNDCGLSPTRSVTLTRANPGTPGLITGATNVCENIAPTGTATTYKIASVASATSYNWAVTAPGAVISHPNGLGATDTVVNILFANFTGTTTVTVSATNGCGTGNTRSLSVTKLVPGTPGKIDVEVTQPCPNRLVKYKLGTGGGGLPTNATSLVWTVPSQGTIVSDEFTGTLRTSITVSYSAAVDSVVSVQAFNNCGSSAIRTTPAKYGVCAQPRMLSKAEGVLAPTETLNVNVFPNPSVSDFKLQVLTAGKELIHVRILDMQGRAFKTLTVMPYQTTTVGSDLKAGAYMLEVTQGNKVKTTKLLKF